MKRALGLILLLVLTLSSVQAADKVIRILAIGNSFSEDAVEQYLYEIGKEEGFELIIGNAYRGGQGFESHWKDVTSGANTFEYRKVVKGKKTNKKGQALKDIVTDEPWDYITLQQVSQDSGRPDTFEPYLSDLIKYVKALATNKKMRLGYHMTWAYAANSTHSGFIYYGNNQMAMYNSITGCVKQVLAKHREFSFVIPSGTAIQNARTSPLGDTMNRDGYHLELNYGRYTAACTWAEILLRKNVEKLQYHPLMISNEVARYCQEAAHKARRHPFRITPYKEEKTNSWNK